MKVNCKLAIGGDILPWLISKYFSTYEKKGSFEKSHFVLMTFDENVICAHRDIISKITDTFGTWDFVIFGLVLLLSAAIGIYFAWVDRKKDSEEYMMGGGKVSPFPIACSLATTFFSAITVLGSPGEYYLYGSMFTYFLVTYGWFYRI